MQDMLSMLDSIGMAGWHTDSRNGVEMCNATAVRMVERSEEVALVLSGLGLRND